MLEKLVAEFGKDRVHFFFYEKFRENKYKTVRDVAQIIGANEVSVEDDNDQIPNRGYSAFSINLSISRYKFLKLVGLDRWLVHRPIVFFGDTGIPAGFPGLSVLPRKKYWGNYFLRDNEEVRSDNYPNLTALEKIKLELSWRSIIKKRVDKLFYWDWDILSHKRAEMDAYFHNENKKLKKYFKANQIPDKYL